MTIRRCSAAGMLANSAVFMVGCSTASFSLTHPRASATRASAARTDSCAGVPLRQSKFDATFSANSAWLRWSSRCDRVDGETGMDHAATLAPAAGGGVAGVGATPGFANSRRLWRSFSRSAEFTNALSLW